MQDIIDKNLILNHNKSKLFWLFFYFIYRIMKIFNKTDNFVYFEDKEKDGKISSIDYFGNLIINDEDKANELVKFQKFYFLAKCLH